MSVRGIHPIRRNHPRKLLVVCDQGNNRSVTIASSLKYADGGHDVLTAGLSTNTKSTLAMLFKWADWIILTDQTQRVPEEFLGKIWLWDVGPDRYPRPHNVELLRKARSLIAQHRGNL